MPFAFEVGSTVADFRHDGKFQSPKVRSLTTLMTEDIFFIELLLCWRKLLSNAVCTARTWIQIPRIFLNFIFLLEVTFLLSLC